MDTGQYFNDQANKLMKNKTVGKIDDFNGEYFGFLNNDFPSLVYFSNLFFPSINAAFQVN